MEFFDTKLFDFVILPILIVCARVVDVSFGTLRLIYLSKGYKWLSSVLGFFEVLIWLLAITRIFANLDNWVSYIAYPLGFSVGIYVGMKIEERIAMGQELIRIITKKDASELILALRRKGYSVTALQAEGSQGEVGILYSIVNRKNIEEYVGMIKEFNPNAFYTIEDVKFVSQKLPTNLRSQRRKVKSK